MNRRLFLGSAAGAGLALAAAPLRAAEIDTSDLRPITGDVQPIAAGERETRLERARALMARHGLDAVLIEPGSSMIYFAGIRWWRTT